MKRSLRAFGIACFLIGALLTVNQMFPIPYLTISGTPEEQDLKKLETQLRDAKKEITTLQAQLKDNGTSTAGTKKEELEKETDTPSLDTTNSPTTPTNKEEQSSDETVKKTIIFVYEGVSLYDIGKQAEEEGIIDNRRELELFLSKPEYARSIQIGQFELDSSMTLEQMARILTGKKSTEN